MVPSQTRARSNRPASRPIRVVGSGTITLTFRSVEVSPDSLLGYHQAVDTSPLDALLGAGEWRAADEETRRLLLADADQGGFIGLDPTEVPNLDCALLLAIDRAWRDASKRRYGFTAQSEILATVRAQGFRRKKVWRVFGTRTGWRQRTWLDAQGLSYRADAPAGHLPWIPGTFPTVSTGRTYEVLFLFYKLFSDCTADHRTT